MPIRRAARPRRGAPVPHTRIAACAGDTAVAGSRRGASGRAGRFRMCSAVHVQKHHASVPSGRPPLHAATTRLAGRARGRRRPCHRRARAQRRGAVPHTRIAACAGGAPLWRASRRRRIRTGSGDSVCGSAVFMCVSRSTTLARLRVSPPLRERCGHRHAATSAPALSSPRDRLARAPVDVRRRRSAAPCWTRAAEAGVTTVLVPATGPGRPRGRRRAGPVARRRCRGGARLPSPRGAPPRRRGEAVARAPAVRDPAWSPSARSASTTTTTSRAARSSDARSPGSSPWRARSDSPWCCTTGRRGTTSSRRSTPCRAFAAWRTRSPRGRRASRRWCAAACTSASRGW